MRLDRYAQTGSGAFPSGSAGKRSAGDGVTTRSRCSTARWLSRAAPCSRSAASGVTTNIYPVRNIRSGSRCSSGRPSPPQVSLGLSPIEPPHRSPYPGVHGRPVQCHPWLSVPPLFAGVERPLVSMTLGPSYPGGVFGCVSRMIPSRGILTLNDGGVELAFSGFQLAELPTGGSLSFFCLSNFYAVGFFYFFKIMFSF